LEEHVESAYLSIDIDFWSYSYEVYENLIPLIDHARTKNIPLAGAVSHHHVLPHVDENPAEVLINVDEHSDHAGPGFADLNCGSWVGHVSWAKDGRYLWLRSGTIHEGRCDGHDSGNWGDGSPWKSMETRKPRKTGMLRDILDHYLLYGVSITLSPGYSDPEVRRAGESLFRVCGIEPLPPACNEDV
jgi:hypothetical protein